MSNYYIPRTILSETRDTRSTSPLPSQHVHYLRNPTGPANALTCRKRNDANFSAFPGEVHIKDDQGVTPLHRACENGAPQGIIDLLIRADPRAIDEKDGKGRRPVDIAIEKSQHDGERIINAFALLRHMATADGNGGIRQKQPVGVATNQSLQPAQPVGMATNQNAMAHELYSSLIMIRRLQEDLATANSEKEAVARSLQDAVKTEESLLERIARLEKQLGAAEAESNSMAERIEHLTKTNVEYRTKLDETSDLVVAIKNDVASERSAMELRAAELKSEACAAQAVSDAFESKLQTALANENLLRTRVSELEAALDDAATMGGTAVVSFQQQEESMQVENARLRSTCTKLTENNSSLQGKVDGLTQAVLGLVEALNSLSAEQQRIILASARHERSCLEHARKERAELLGCIQRQRQYLQASAEEQEGVLSRAAQREEEAHVRADEERQTILSSLAEEREGYETFGCVEKEREEIQQTDGGQP